MLYDLFKACAYEVVYKECGDKVNYAFVEKKDKLIIFFECSNGLEDWKANFDFKKEVYGLFNVHRGFYNCYYQVRNIVLDKAYSKDYKEIIVVGYSHGGSLCQLALQDLVYHFPNKDIKGFAFESPRCLKVPKQYRFYWKNLTTTRVNQDLITHLPPRLFGFNDLGTMLKIKGDTSMVRNHLPKCIKSHYPEVVLQALKEYEHF